MIDRHDLPRETLPRGQFRLSDLPDHVPNYSGNIENVPTEEVPRSVHLAFAIAITNVDQYMAFPDAKRDTLDALGQAWQAVAQGDVEVEYSRSATGIETLD